MPALSKSSAYAAATPVPSPPPARHARWVAYALLGGALGAITLLAVAVHQTSTAPRAVADSSHARAQPLSKATPADTNAVAVALLPPLTGFVGREFNPEIDHWGVDLAVAEGTAVLAPADGVVVLADATEKGGHTVVLQHAKGLTTVFKHNARVLVHTGERVRAGSIVALSGNTGEWSEGPHLHYEVWLDGEPVDPKPFLAPW